MISRLRGTLTYVSEGKIEIDTGMMAFEVSVTGSVLNHLPNTGAPIEIFTYLNVKEDEMSLFGFATRDELHLFKLLITVSGIGPKGALSILSVLNTADLRFAILAGDPKAIAKAPGIGKKTAEKLIIELKDKVALSDGFSALQDLGGLSADGQTATIRPIDTQNSAVADAIDALTALGYSPTDAYKALQNIDQEGKDTEALLKEALKIIGR